MSEIRTKHPGLWGVSMALAIPWYCGLGIAFIAGHKTLARVTSAFDLTFQYIPGIVWGFIWVALGLLLAISVNTRRIPQDFVRGLLIIGWLMTVFFLGMFIATDLTGGQPAITAIPSFLSFAIIQFLAIIEEDFNPRMARKKKKPLLKVKR